MAFLENVHPVDVFMGSLNTGDDLLKCLTNICVDKRIHLGRIEGLGAVQKAVIGYYDQEQKQYLYKKLDQALEIAALTGNISVKDEKPFVHAHITLANQEGQCFGGHLAEGTLIFACEYIIQTYGGPELHRQHDPVTDLHLWKKLSG